MRNKAYEAWVSSFVANLAEHFHLHDWSIGVKFSLDEDDGKRGTYAENEINSAYMYSTVTFYSQSRWDFEAGKFEHLISAVVHELVHIFLDPFQVYMHPHLSLTTTPLFSDMLENQTQKLTVAFLKTLPKSVIPPRPKKHGKHNTTPADDKSSPAVHS